MLKPDRFSCSQKIRLKRDPPVYCVAMLKLYLVVLADVMPNVADGMATVAHVVPFVFGYIALILMDGRLNSHCG